MSTLLLCAYMITNAQNASIEGYIYETGNRGYLSGVDVTIENIATDKVIGKTFTDEDGFFKVEVPQGIMIRLYAAKEMFDIKKLDVEIGTGKSFVKLEMGRKPGYTFEVTLAEKRDNEDIVVDAIKGSRIEVYNNTKRTSIMDLKSHMSPEFQLNLEKGNHYTILIRKEGYLSKRMEAKVDVEGCILCFEGVGRVDPGVSDNLTEGNAFGVLLANVELERLYEGKTMDIQNLYYKTGKWKPTSEARVELNKVITLMKDNPGLTVELGSHTDSRGKSAGNMRLSQKRAQAAVDYLIDRGDIRKLRIVSRGYGETQLKNECANGVKCSDKKHALNRRTELKIVGITNVADIKSLKRMKEEEHMEEEILKLMDQKEVRATSKEDLEKLLAEKSKTTVSDSRSDNRPVITPKEKSTPPAVKDDERPVFEDHDIEEEEVLVPKTEIKQPPLGDFVKKTEVQEPPKESEKERIARQKQELLDRKNRQPQFTETTKTGRESAVDMDRSTPSTKGKVLEGVTGLTLVEEGTPLATGFKIVIKENVIPLVQKDEIFVRHAEVEVIQKDGGYYYMLGGFRDRREATDFYKSFISKQYKGSYLVTFEDGIMVKLKR